MNKDAVRHIAGLEHLKDLRVRSLDVEPFSEVDRSDSLFPALRRLTLWAESVIFVINFLKILDRAPLETIVVTVNEDSTTVNPRALFSAIHSYSFTRSASLTSITVEFRGDFGTAFGNDAIYAIGSSVIRPLFEFPNLRHMQLSSPAGFILDNEFVDDMARAWRQLESLSIECQHATIFDSASNPTIMALQSLSRHCPHLRDLSLLVNATNIQMDHLSRSPPTIHATLRSWDYLYSPIDSPVEVADFLSSLFPSLSKIFTSMFSVYEPQWEEVRTLVPLYARIRANERRFGMVNHVSPALCPI
ncbi:hypothetical protein C8J57DRAFT_1096745 [Mycena rebaudengoi]|nr:hypothetical protein C8J57DRAFT_1096745 [Mycena rebaudengoi]